MRLHIIIYNRKAQKQETVEKIPRNLPQKNTKKTKAGDIYFARGSADATFQRYPFAFTWYMGNWADAIVTPATLISNDLPNDGNAGSLGILAHGTDLKTCNSLRADGHVQEIKYNNFWLRDAVPVYR